MSTVFRHRCLIYDGAPSRHLPALASLTREHLQLGYRCLYLNSPPMVSGMRSYLAAAGVDVAHEVGKTSLVLTSDREQLKDGRFDVQRMLDHIEGAIHKALSDGYRGLLATGDMAWEFGGERDFSKLLDYEWRLEELFRRYPALSGICQYHKDTLPDDVMRQGLVTHPSILINETLSRMNLHYVHDEPPSAEWANNPGLDSVVGRLCRLHDTN